MSNPTKLPFNILIVIFIVFSLIGLFWLNRSGLEAGSAYFELSIVGLVFLIICALAKLAKVDFWFEIPINRGDQKAVLMFLFGLFTLFLLISIAKFSGKQFYSPYVMAPLADFSTETGALSFTALKAASSSFWTFFIGVICAAVIEEIVLGFAFVKMGSLMLGAGLRRLLNLDFGSNNEYWDFAGAMLFSVILFCVLHSFNKTYLNPDGSWAVELFMFAALFRLVMNILIYKFGNFGLMYSIGVHMANNAVVAGSVIVFAALATFPGGVLLDAIAILILVYGVSHFMELVRSGELIAKDFITFD